MSVYWNGATTLAGASFSDRLTQASASIASTPNSVKRTRSRGDGVTHPNGAASAPNTNVPPIWPATSTVSVVSRNARVTIIRKAKSTLPASAMSTGGVKLALDACNPSLPDERCEQDQSRGAAHEQKLADRIVRKQPLAERIVDRKQKRAGQHQADTGKRAAGAALGKVRQGSHSAIL